MSRFASGLPEGGARLNVFLRAARRILSTTREGTRCCNISSTNYENSSLVFCVESSYNTENAMMMMMMVCCVPALLLFPY